MTDIAISALPDLPLPLVGPEPGVFVQNGVTYKATPQIIFDYVSGAYTYGNGIDFTANTLSVDANSTNLKFDTGVLNTIQDIDATANPFFNSVNLVAGANINSTSSFPTFSFNYLAVAPSVPWRTSQLKYKAFDSNSDLISFASIGSDILDLTPGSVSGGICLQVTEAGNPFQVYQNVNGLTKSIEMFRRLKNLVGYQSFQEQLLLSASQNVDTSIIGRTVVNDTVGNQTLTILAGDTLPGGATFDMLRAGSGTFSLLWPDGVTVNGVNGPGSIPLPQQYDRSRQTKIKLNDYTVVEYSGAIGELNWQDVYYASVLAAQNYWVQSDANPLVIKDQNSNDAFRFESDTSTNNNLFRITNTLGQVELSLRNDLNPGIQQVLGWHSVSGWNDSAQRIIYSRITDELLSAVGGAETVKRTFQAYKGGPNVLLDFLTFNTSTDTTTIENSNLIVNYTDPTLSVIDSLNTTGTNSYQIKTILTDATPATESATFETWGLNAGVQRLVTRYTGLTDSYLINRNTTFSNHSVSDISNLTVQLSATFNNSASAGGAFTVKTASQSQAFHIQMSTETAKFDIPLTTHDFTLTQTTNIFPEISFFADSTGTAAHNDALIDLDCRDDADTIKSSNLLQVTTTNAVPGTFSQNMLMQAWSFNVLTDVLSFVGTERALYTAPVLNIQGDAQVDPQMAFVDFGNSQDDDAIAKYRSVCNSSDSVDKSHSLFTHIVRDALSASFSTETLFNGWFKGTQSTWLEVKGQLSQVEMFTNFTNYQDDATYGTAIDIEGYKFTDGNMISVSPASIPGGACRTDTFIAQEAIPVGAVMQISDTEDFKVRLHITTGNDSAMGVSTTAAAADDDPTQVCWAGDVMVQLQDGTGCTHGDLLVPSDTTAGRAFVDGTPGPRQSFATAWQTVVSATPGPMVKCRIGYSTTS